MKKFMVLYMASGAEFEKMMKNSTPEQQKNGMDAWMKWMNANKTSIVEAERLWERPSALIRTEPQIQKMRSAAIRLCRPNRMMRPRRYSARTIPICSTPAHG
jgi:hypothetical protein